MHQFAIGVFIPNTLILFKFIDNSATKTERKCLNSWGHITVVILKYVLLC